MKHINSILLSSLMLSLGVFIAACSSEENDFSNLPKVVDFTDLSSQINSEGYWEYCYDTEIGAVRTDGFSLTHTAQEFDYGDMIFYDWMGFCPSQVDDTKDYADDWVNHQWASMAANPYKGSFMVGNSGSMVSANPLDNTTCSVEMIDNGYFIPSYVYVNNSSYTYYCAKEGSDFNEAFTPEDSFELHIVGVLNGMMTKHLTVPLIKNNSYVTQWMGVSLETFGTVDKLLFYVDSTSKNEYGLCVPSYFCMTNLAYFLPETL